MLDFYLSMLSLRSPYANVGLFVQEPPSGMTSRAIGGDA